MYGIDYSIKKDITVPDFMFRAQEVVQRAAPWCRRTWSATASSWCAGPPRSSIPHRARDGESGERLLTGSAILIATGSAPSWPEGAPQAPDRLYDSDSILHMDTLPRSMAIIGAGVIGCEYATTFRALGIEVVLVGSQDRLLPFLDHEIGERLRMQMKLLGLEVVLGDSLQEVALGAVRDRGARLSSGRELRVEDVLFATGRLGATGSLALANARPHGRSARPPVGERALPDRRAPHLRGRRRDRLPGARRHVDGAGPRGRLPCVRLQDPRVVAPATMRRLHDPRDRGRWARRSGVGREKGSTTASAARCYRGNARGQIVGDLAGLVKLVLRAREDLKLLGVHVLGEMASELIHVGQACLHFGGTIEYFIQEVFNYPTLGEAYKYAAYDGLGARASS